MTSAELNETGSALLNNNQTCYQVTKLGVSKVNDWFSFQILNLNIRGIFYLFWFGKNNLVREAAKTDLYNVSNFFLLLFFFVLIYRQCWIYFPFLTFSFVQTIPPYLKYFFVVVVVVWLFVSLYTYKVVIMMRLY